MSDYHINIFFSEEDGGYIADIPDLDSCAGFGPTPEEALENIKDALQNYWKAVEEQVRGAEVREIEVEV